MTKPHEYQKQRIIRCDTHYHVADRSPKDTAAASGTLTTGRVVWVGADEDAPAHDATVAVFAEGIGVVSVQAGSLGA